MMSTKARLTTLAAVAFSVPFLDRPSSINEKGSEHNLTTETLKGRRADPGRNINNNVSNASGVIGGNYENSCKAN